MLTPSPTKAFRKETQQLAVRGRDIVKMLMPLSLLMNRLPLPPQYKDHPLKGQWKGYREFHIEPNWILIYKTTENSLILARTGTHADLFNE